MLVFGQIGKGVYTFKPDFGVSNIEIGNGIRTTVAPEFGVFIHRKILLEGRLSHNFIDFQYLGTQNQNFSEQLKVTYYYFDFQRWKPYVSLGAEGNQTKIVAIKPSPFGYPKSLATYALLGEIAAGVHYFANKNLAIDANFNFTLKKQITQQYINSQFNVGLKPFFSSASYKGSAETSNFLYKGKFAPKGNINFLVFHKILSVRVAGDYFLTKNVSIGSGINLFASKGSNSLATSLALGYYFHLKKRWYANFDLNTTYSFKNKNNRLSLNSGIFRTKISSNIHYFLNKNIAIMAGAHYGKVLNSEIFRTYFNNNLYLDIGLKYFL